MLMKTACIKQCRILVQAFVPQAEPLLKFFWILLEPFTDTSKALQRCKTLLTLCVST